MQLTLIESWSFLVFAATYCFQILVQYLHRLFCLKYYYDDLKDKLPSYN